MRQTGHIDLIGSSASILELKAEVERVARSDAKVLITGESGVGKEIVARAIGALSLRASAPFVPVNCAGIPETLLESELFGHLKGSFTGAYRDKPGKLEMASNGTIFLDEIGEMTLRMQGLLLRFLETGEIQKVGAERVAMAPNVRVLAATNRNLRDLIAQGQFREDLFYRINVIHLVVPPLRERREDIPPLIEHFLANFTSAASGAGQGNGNGAGKILPPTIVRGITPEAIVALCEYSWPGNVRQLRERHRAPGGHRTPRGDPRRRSAARNPLAGHRHAAATRTAPDGCRRPVQEADRRRESFWTAVYPLYMNREITRGNVRDLVHKGLEESRGNYKILLRLFNMETRDYKRFLNFLRKHDCQLPFKEYRK